MTRQRATLTVIPGGRNQPALVTLPQADVDELRIELHASVTDRVAHTRNVRVLVRDALRSLARRDVANVTRHLLELERVNERETLRACSVHVPASMSGCPCGADGPGHGIADVKAVAA